MLAAVACVWSGVGHDHRIDVVGALVEHAPKILVFGRIRKLLERARSPIPVGIRQRHDILRRYIPQVLVGDAARAYAGDIQQVAGRAIADAAQHVPGHNRYACRRERGVAQKGATRKLVHVHDISAKCVLRDLDPGKTPGAPDLQGNESAQGAPCFAWPPLVSNPAW